MTSRARAAATRFAGLLVLWVALIGAAPLDVVFGCFAAAAATAASLRLLQAGALRPAPLAALGFALRFLGQSLLAGIDVARRAFDPRLPLNPGFVVHRVRLPDGPGRALFGTVASLIPGTLPAAADADGTLHVHCLDVGQPVAAQLAAEEARFARAIGAASRDG